MPHGVPSHSFRGLALSPEVRSIKACILLAFAFVGVVRPKHSSVADLPFQRDCDRDALFTELDVRRMTLDLTVQLASVVGRARSVIVTQRKETAARPLSVLLHSCFFKEI